MSGILAALAGIKTAIATAVDEYFNRTTLLLNTSSTNGAQNNTFLDSSTNNFTITRNGNTTQGTFTPFSQTGWSNYFASNSGIRFADSADFSMGTNAFTIECFVYLTKTQSAGSGFISQWVAANDSNSSWQLGVDWNGGSGGNKFAGQLSIGGTVTTINDTTNFTLNTWHHVALCRSGSPGTVALFVDGVRVASTSLTGSIVDATNQVGIGVRGGSDDYYMDGVYISNARVVNGTDVYGATNTTLTVPTAPLTAITNTKLLTCQGNRFLDANTQVTAKAVSQVLGTPSVQAFSPFAPTAAYDTAVVGGSGYFDGSGDYLTFTDSANDLDLGGLVASFEAWVYPTSAASAQHFAYKHGGALSWSASNGIEYAIAFDVNKFYFVYNNGGSPAFITGATTRQPYQWHHVVVATDASNNVALFVNGVREGTATNAITKPTTRTTITVGVNVTGGEPIFGYVSGQRFIKGSGAYDPTQTTITVPTAPPTAVTNTKLLLNFTNSGIFDSTAKNVLETVGNAQVSTTQAKWGTTSMYFDGTGDYALMRDTPLHSFGTGDFTIEFWLNTSQNSSEFVIIDFRTANGAFPMIAHDSTRGVFYYLNSDYRISSSTILTNNTWYHVAVSRSGSSTKMFIDGTQVGSTYTDSTSLGCGAMRPVLGINGANLSNLAMTGYLDDLRITRYARYVSNFSVPTAAFPLQ